ncbi:FUSC family protein [Xanthomonas hyacinthi]|uniref:Fusaric acid resistance protein n=2 Tax=Xanthomonas hyacinthi TaxID=56455 RepID=A0A2S7EQR1_9XANT|nr:fusaric acid resistance protein [Xanthomonas hyacinthi]QGY78795.1 FUSC family protein [Xanthomonas hyacinthi]
MRSILAAWLALVVAYLLELETPYSAASTVLLVIHPIQGAIIGKGTWRVLGTLLGMGVAIVLMSAFAQMPWLFLLGFGLWLGLCVAGMTLLRHFRASGAVVAGYTVGLATFGALQHPQMTFDHVIGRGSTVMVGVVCLGLVSALFSTRGVRGRLDALLSKLAAATADVLATQHEALGGDSSAASSTRVTPARRGLIAEIYGVDDLLALGKAESTDLAQRAVAVRHAMASLFAALVGGMPPLPPTSASAQALRTLQPTLEQAWRESREALVRGPGGIEQAIQAMRQARERLVTALHVTVLDALSEQASLLITGDRLIEQIDDYLAALDGIAALHGPRPRATPPAVQFYRDTTAAIQNGLRAMLTLVLAGAFWIVTGWPHGDMMLLVLAPYCALLATAGNPAAGAVEFVKGTMVAVPMAFFCAFGVLPHIEGLPLLLVVLGLFWLPGIYATSIPQHGLAGLAYLVGFNTLTAAANPMHSDFSLFLNWSVAWVLATFFTLLGFRLLLPRDLARDIARLRRRIRDEALAVLQGKRVDRRHWQWRQHHRMAQLGALLKSQPTVMDHAMGDALASLHLGRELLRLRHWLRYAPPTSALKRSVAIALQRMAYRASDPLMAARHARHAARTMNRVHADDLAGAADRQRLAAALIDIAELFEGHTGYFSTLPNRRSHAQ